MTESTITPREAELAAELRESLNLNAKLGAQLGDRSREDLANSMTIENCDMFRERCAELEAQVRAMRSAALATPDGYALVPARMHLDSSVIEHIAACCGDGDNQFGDYLDGVLWVGSIEDDEGRKTHGLHIASAECLQEGSATLVEFAQLTPAAAPKP